MNDDDTVNDAASVTATRQVLDLFRDTAAPNEMRHQIAMLRAMLLRLIQDHEALTAALQQSGAVRAEELQKSRLAMLLKDHSSAGPNPWEQHSYAKYLLQEPELLTRFLGCSPEQRDALLAKTRELELMS